MSAFLLDGRQVPLQRLTKVLYPDAGVTKAQVVRHLLHAAERMLPHLRDRPLTMRRWPDGIRGEGFFQKTPPEYFPSWVTTVELPRKRGGTKRRVVVQDEATLAYLAGQAVLEFHVWTSTSHHPDRPDRVVVDLDPGLPGTQGWEQAREGALALLDVLDDLDLPAFPMVTGSRGVHLLLPLEPRAPRGVVRSFADDLAQVLVDREPTRYTRELSKGKREGRLFVDTLRNAPSQTSIAPYSPRARPGAPVATPVTRRELEDPALRPDAFRIPGFHERLAGPDPWSGWRGARFRLRP